MNKLGNSEPEPEPEPEPDDVSQPSLVGTWYWLGTPYYVFLDDGTGTMAGEDIRWHVQNGYLIICTTPGICGTTCIAPARWYYDLRDDTLSLESADLPGFNFEYTRR